MDSFASLWESVKKECQNNISETIYGVWFKELEFVSFIDNVATLETAEFKRGVLESKFMDVIRNAFEKVFGFEVDVMIIDKVVVVNEEDAGEKPTPVETSDENTFRTFIVGSSNKFAHAAAMAVAENPGKAYNPLFIYGNSGLGKTHLLNAIGNEIKANNPSAAVKFTRGEDFTNQLIYYLNIGQMSQFHNIFRNNDVLLVDDVQFIGGKERTQEEFFHTFNALVDAGKQIVLTSDKPPKEISRLDERLQTRFEWGLIADIQPPDLETRMAIIKRKAKHLDVEISDEIVLFIAEKLKNNIRQLEGAVKTIKAYTTMRSSTHVNLATAQSAIKDVLHDNQPPAVTVERIIEEVARTYNIDPADITSKKQDANTSKYRQISMYIVSKMTGLSTKAIGTEFGGKDHSTVLYAIKKIKDEVDKNSSLRNTIKDIMKNVEEGRE